MTLSDFRYFRDNPERRGVVDRIELGIEDETEPCPDCGGEGTVMVSDTPWGVERPQPCYRREGERGGAEVSEYDFERMEERWDRMRQDSRARGQAAAMMNEPGVRPEPGHYYTVSPDFVCGDRSWTDHLLYVQSVNDGTALVELIPPFMDDKLRLLPIAERYWYPADDMADAMLEARK